MSYIVLFLFFFLNHKLLPVWTNNQFLSGSGDNLVQYAEGKRLVLSWIIFFLPLFQLI